MTKADRPQFLKIAYNGPKALEELASFDPSITVGVLGGGAGTTRDCFELLNQAEKYGARVALFGRKINLAEDPLAMVSFMREVASGNIQPPSMSSRVSLVAMACTKRSRPAAAEGTSCGTSQSRVCSVPKGLTWSNDGSARGAGSMATCVA